MRRKAALLLAAATITASVELAQLAAAPSARADIGGTACTVIGTIGEGWMGKACKGVLGVGKRIVGGGKKVAKVLGNPLVQRAAGLAAILAWVLGGAKWTMDHMASVISSTTSPTVTASWFTGVYLRVEAIAVFFTVLFLFAAAAEAMLRSELSVLSRAVFAYLPLAMLMTAVAAPVTMLLLDASDQLSAGLATVAGGGATHFLTGPSAWVLGGLTLADPFFAVMAGGLVVAAGGALWVEMLVREIAVYVVVAMLPLVFAAMVWPARRVWATRTVEVLVALILSKVAIVVVLALGGAALDHAGVSGVSKLLGGLALVILGAFSPWLLLRLIPMAEVASAAVGHIRGHVHASTGVRTPEAALAARAANRASGGTRGNTNGNGNGFEGAAGGVAVSEMLEQMQRRANGHPSATGTPAAAQPLTAAGPPGSRSTSNGSRFNGEHAQRPPTTRSTAADGQPTEPFASPGNGAGEQTEMLRPRDDGSWEPVDHAHAHAHAHADSAAPPLPSSSAWESGDPRTAPDDEVAGSGMPERVRDPRDPGLAGPDHQPGGEEQ